MIPSIKIDAVKYFLRGLVYFLAAFLPALGAALASAQPLTLAMILAFGAGFVAVGGFLDKTAGQRACATPEPPVSD